MSEVVIDVKNLSKVYKLYNRPLDRLKESLSLNNKKYHSDYYALRDVNFSVRKGEILGIVGTNGSGKSTLLKIITGVLNPSDGHVRVNGTISALLELGAGFNPEYTGLQNIYLHGTMMNKTKEEIENKLQEIIDFADIGDFINQPVKTYSSGMFVRLAFSVATNIKPDVLVVDEALSVGDINFQMKSINRIKELISEGTTVLFVSHDIITVKTLCNKAIYLNSGEVVAYGESGSICDLYLKNQNMKNGLTSTNDGKHLHKQSRVDYGEESLTNDADIIEAFKSREGTGKVIVTNVIIENEKQEKCKNFYYGEQITVRVYVEVKEDIDSLILALYLRNRNQIEVIGSNTKYENITLKNLSAQSKLMVMFDFTNYLQEGEYGVSTILADEIPTTEFYDKLQNAIIVKSSDHTNQKRWALVGIPMSVEYKLL
ncbi:ABC transporter ATP-binding protein [Paenibacillus alvei]|uniref:ABC transporter ATP-binding protein n=1 Tax=Paenibacillus alvei TaxID=44250 RepID=UPI0003855FC3|nr:ABC transporter ATP-binding protein [Paenibacillus alvei]EPY09452.1 O-antigen export system ATP-binding protein RfbB [Paenibacillus alvei A6-6i-x]